MEEAPVVREEQGPVAGLLRVQVDRERCQGHARCVAVASELFQLDAFGNAHEIGDGIVSPDLEVKVRLAASYCPELAISIIEKQGG